MRPFSRRIWIAVLLLNASAALAGQTEHAKKPPMAAPCGPMAGQALQCPQFGFSYKVPVGWVDRTEYMEQDADEASTDAASQKNDEATKSKTLLAIFSRPPGAPGETINSAVVILAESLTNYHGVKTAADYFGPITELAEERGFKVVNEPYSFPAGTKQLVRGDFNKERGKLTMWQTSLVTIANGYVVSFTFVGGDEDEVASLIGNLSFGTRGSATPRAPKK